MRTPSTAAKLTAWAGLMVGGLAWAANTQLGEILPTADCTGRVRLSAIISFAAAIIVLACSALSWQLDSHPSVGDDRSLPFSSKVSALAGLVFAFALVMQGTASLMVNACER